MADKNSLTLAQSRSASQLSKKVDKFNSLLSGEGHLQGDFHRHNDKAFIRSTDGLAIHLLRADGVPPTALVKMAVQVLKPQGPAG